MSDVLLVEVNDGIATVTLNRPKMNPINSELQRALVEMCDELAERDDVRAMVLWGGDRVFAAGADVKEMQAMSFTDMVDASRRMQSCMDKVAKLPFPTVAAITGYALGGGCELALSCDFRIAAEDAKLGQPEVALGVIPGMGGSQRLPRLVGTQMAKDLIFTGRFIDADEALRIGLVDEVVPADKVYETALERMRRYVGGPRYAIRFAKEAIDQGMGVDLQTGLEIERFLFASCFATKDRDLGMTSFVENGPGKAVFEGK